MLKYGDPNDLDVLCDRAEAFLMYEKYDEGLYKEYVESCILLFCRQALELLDCNKMHEIIFSAIEDYQKAVNGHEESRRAREGLHKAQKLKKQVGKRDYYKILGIRK